MTDFEISPAFKGFPPSSWGSTGHEFLATKPQLSDFQTPLLSLSKEALDSNVAVMANWLGQHGFEIAPHGKTTMAPQLWRQLLDAGAWGITLATPWQVQVGRNAGLTRIMLANSIVDRVSLEWLAVELNDTSFDFMSWVDSVETVDAMTSVLSGISLSRPVDVIVELGAAGARTGARTLEQAVLVADAVRASPVLRLRGVGGYEGAVAHDRSATSVAAVEKFLAQLVELTALLDFEGRRPVITAGGSAYVELVAQAFDGVNATRVLRSGAYQIHDDGYYDGVSPLGSLRAAMKGWARVVSRPEPGLALLDGGRRDFPYDYDLPTVLDVAGARVTAINDQHLFVEVESEDDLPVGTVVRLGLSHPCTAMDKWRWVPVTASDDDHTVVDIVRTLF